MGFLRFLLSIATFILTMVLALFAFSYTAHQLPIDHAGPTEGGAIFPRTAPRNWPLPDNYMVWMDIFLQQNQIVLVGFSIATRILIGIVFGILGLLFGGARVRPGRVLQQLRVPRSAAGAEGASQFCVILMMQCWREWEN